MPGETSGTAARLLAISALRIRVLEHVGDRAGVVLGLVALDEDSRSPVLDNLSETADEAATTGVPSACASSATSPKLSVSDGTTHTSAMA